MAGDDLDPRVEALARAAEKATRAAEAATARVKQLDEFVEELALNLEGLGRAVAGSKGGLTRSWLLGDSPEEAGADLADLTQWLDAVYLRYPGASLKSCWLWHPWVVEELRWLRNAHHDAFNGPGSTWTAIGVWHDGQRPGVVARIAAGLATCELGRHEPGEDQAQPPALAPLAAYVGQIADTWTTSGTSPEPSSEQLRQAEDHDHPKRRANH